MQASPNPNEDTDDTMDVDKKYVTLVTLDGVVMGHMVNLKYTTLL